MDDTNTMIPTTITGNKTLEYPTRVIEKPPFEMVEVMIGMVTFVGFVLSIICLIFHLLKLFKSTQKQNLQIKNLTNYCICLLILYVFKIFFTLGDYVLDGWLILKLINMYFHITECLLLWIMAVHACLSVIFNQKPYHFILTDDNKFWLYSIIGWILPVPLVFIIYKSAPSDPPGFISTIIIRLLALILCFISLWFIRSIGWNRSNVIKDFSIYKRILILTAIVSSVPSICYGMALLFEKDGSIRNALSLISRNFYTMEGLIVGLYFTFKEDTFESNIKNTTEMTRG